MTVKQNAVPPQNEPVSVRVRQALSGAWHRKSASTTYFLSVRCPWLLGLALAANTCALAKDYETVEFTAAHLGGMKVGFNLILPRDYASSARRYPALYLLHGYTDHYPAWVSYTNLTQYARSYQEIIVMPEGDNGYYTNNWANPKLAWEDFLILDLIPFVDSHYRTVASRQGRAIAGLSMGGYGAIKLALKYRHLFAAAASLSGSLAAAQRERGESDTDAESKKAKEAAFGPPDNPERGANDPFELVKNLPVSELPQLYLSVGEDDHLMEDNRRFVRLLAQFKIPYEYREVPGIHEWPLWDQQIQVVLVLQAPVISALGDAHR